MPLPARMVGDAWGKRTSRIIFPWLIYTAKSAQELSYKDVNAEIVVRKLGPDKPERVYGHPLGYVGDALREIEAALRLPKIPPLNALVVNDLTRIPGNGCQHYLEDYYESKFKWRELDDQQKREITSEMHDRIHAYEHWDDVQHYLGDAQQENPELAPFVGPFTQVSWQAQRKARAAQPGSSTLQPYFKPPKNYGGHGESQEHKDLKRYILHHPDLVGLRATAKGEEEHEFGSGDAVDIEFIDGNICLEVEVKARNAPDGDILRGVWQCVKYKHLAQAQQKLDRLLPNSTSVRSVRTILVVGRKIPDVIRLHADCLGIPYVEVVVP